MADNWMLTTNAEYQKIVNIVMNLATAALIVPITFRKEIMGSPDHLPWEAYSAWVCLVLSVASGLVFLYVSAKYVKEVSKNPQSPDEPWFETYRDWASWITGGLFALGMVFTGWFVYVALERSLGVH